MNNSVTDPDLQIRGRPCHPDPEISGGTGLKNILLRPFGPHFGLKIREGRVPRAPSLDPPLQLAFSNDFAATSWSKLV